MRWTHCPVPGLRERRMQFSTPDRGPPSEGSPQPRQRNQRPSRRQSLPPPHRRSRPRCPHPPPATLPTAPPPNAALAPVATPPQVAQAAPPPPPISDSAASAATNTGSGLRVTFGGGGA